MSGVAGAVRVGAELACEYPASTTGLPVPCAHYLPTDVLLASALCTVSGSPSTFAFFLGGGACRPADPGLPEAGGQQPRGQRPQVPHPHRVHQAGICGAAVGCGGGCGVGGSCCGVRVGTCGGGGKRLWGWVHVGMHVELLSAVAQTTSEGLLCLLLPPIRGLTWAATERVDVACCEACWAFSGGLWLAVCYGFRVCGLLWAKD